MHRALAVLALGSTLILLGGCDDDPTSASQNAALAKAGSGDGPTNFGGGPAHDTQIDLAWDDNSRNESGYELHRSTTGATGEFTLLARTAPNVINYSDKGLTPTTEYCYKVRWFRTQGKATVSAFSDIACIKTLGKPPVPQNVVAIPSVLHNVVIDINWIDPTTVAHGYRIERAALPEGPWEQFPPDLAWWTRSRRDENRPTEVQSCYRVLAFNSFGATDFSTPACTTPPRSPANLTATAAVGQVIDLAWEDRSSFEDGYEVQRSTDGTSFTVVAMLPANATTHRDAGLADNRYFYRVRATRSGGFSGFSGIANALAAGAAPTASPTITVAVSGSTVISIGWSVQSANADGYRAERSVDNGASWETAGTVSPFGTWFSDAERTPEQRVCYRVIAFNLIGDAPAANMQCVTPPAPVTDLVATPGGNGAVQLRWTDPSQVNIGYALEILQVYYGGYYGYYEWWSQIAVLDDVTSYRVEGLSDGTFHQFRLVPLSPNGSGDPSGAAGSYTEPAPAAPMNAVPPQRE